MRLLGFPVVATSGNLTDEPICTGRREAVGRLGGIAEMFLMHDRPIRRHVDDSIVRVMMGRELVLRRSRGYAPLPVRVPGITRRPRTSLVAVGAHLKNAVAVASGDNVFIGQHIGDLETDQAYTAFRNSLADLSTLYRVTPESVGCDMHPSYMSTTHAGTLGRPTVPVQHHLAHVASCMAENNLSGEVLGVSWDGTGYGTDGTVWGGEFLLVDGASWRRAATFRPFMLPGGDSAVREPRRSALGCLYELTGEGAVDIAGRFPAGTFSPRELKIFGGMLRGGVNSPRTSSAGRLFDAVASLAGVRQLCRFEGQAAMEMEFLAARSGVRDGYPFCLHEARPAVTGPDAAGPIIVDWAGIIEGVMGDVRAGAPAPVAPARFHNTLAEIILTVARRVGVERIVLTGGCFQNKILTERTVVLLRAGGFRPYWHQRVPPNDGGIALGQIYAVVTGLATPRGPGAGPGKQAEKIINRENTLIEVNHVPGHTW